MTMNEMDDETRREYDQYANEVQQVEWERAEQARKLRWVEDSLRQALAEFDAEQACPTCGIAHTDGSACQHDVSQAQHHVPEHTHDMAVTADNTIPTVSDDVKRIDTKGWGMGMGADHDGDHAHDEWLEELYAREELERAERETEEGRDDH